jgi:hypothetical protein
MEGIEDSTKKYTRRRKRTVVKTKRLLFPDVVSLKSNNGRVRLVSDLMPIMNTVTRTSGCILSFELFG